VTKATPKLPPRFLRRLYIAEAFAMSSFFTLDIVMVVSGIKRNPIPTPRTILGHIMVLKSASRLNWDIRCVEYAETIMPKASRPFGFTFVTSFPAIGMAISVAIPPGPRTIPASVAV
jgi:hypothetical protein